MPTPAKKRHPSELASVGLGNLHGGVTRHWERVREEMKIKDRPARVPGPVPARCAKDYIFSSWKELSERLRARWSFADCWRTAIKDGKLANHVSYDAFQYQCRQFADRTRIPLRAKEQARVEREKMDRASQRAGAVIDVEVVLPHATSKPAESAQQVTTLVVGSGSGLTPKEQRLARKRAEFEGAKSAVDHVNEAIKASISGVDHPAQTP